MDFNLNFLDSETYTPLTHVITINDSANWVARIRFDNNWSKNEFGEKFIHRLGAIIIDWKINKPKAEIRATYESSNGTEFEGFNYNVELNNDIKNNITDWNKIQQLQEAINQLIQSPVIGFDVKDVFKNDVDKPHDTTPIFEHPTHFKCQVTPDTGVGDGKIKVFALGGTAPFEARLDGGSWETLTTENIGGNNVDTFEFTNLTAIGGGELDGSYQIRVRDSRSPKVAGKNKFYFV